MIQVRPHNLGFLAIILGMIGSSAWAARAHTGVPDTWTAAAPLPEGRMNPAAASADGRLYVFGGGACTTGFCRTFEAYDFRTNIWTAMGDMPEAMSGILSATLGPDGHIYIYGGHADRSGATMLVYDPRANTWAHEVPAPGVDGTVLLVTGGDGRIYAVGAGSTQGSTVLAGYDPSTHRWVAKQSFPTLRFVAGGAVGPDGRIYVIGSSVLGRGPDRVEAYDPRTDSWSSVAPLPTSRGDLQVATGPDGRIYAIGGVGRCFTSPCNVVEAYDVRTNTWTAVAPMPHPRWLFVAAVGPDSRIYILGGSQQAGSVPAGSLVTAVDAYTVIPAGQPLPAPKPGPTSVTVELAPMPTGRQDLGVVGGTDGKLYAIGGEQVVAPQVVPPGVRSKRPDILRTVEMYDPKTNFWATAPSLPTPRQGMGVARGPDGRIYVLGGVAIPWDQGFNSSGIAGVSTVFIYNPTTLRWSKGKPMPDGRYAMAAVTSTDGRIYTIGGATHCYPDDALLHRVVPLARSLVRPMLQPGGRCEGTQTVRRFDPRTGIWKALASLRIGRVMPAAAVGLDGRIYVFGGDGLTGPPDPRFEIYDPRSNRWSWGPKAPHVRANAFAAATAADGRIDLIGGCLLREVHMGGYSATCAPPSPVDAYTPSSNTWTTLGLTLNARLSLAATTGPDGRVYAVGGVGDGNGRLLEVLPAR
jgi:N-acetylneuraminic acid mutarotase